MHDEPQHLYGYHGDKRAQKANVIIRRKHISAASNDIGFFRTEDGTYEAIISEYDQHKYNEAWLIKLKRSYSEGVIRKQFRNKNIPMQVQTRADGTIKIIGHIQR